MSLVDDPLVQGVVFKRNFTAEQRRQATKEGHAIAGSYPIYNEEDLSNAMSLLHHASPAQRAHVKRWAKKLGKFEQYKDRFQGGDSED